MIQVMTYSSDGKILVTAGEDGTIKLWRLDSEQKQPSRE
jgi:WD40 repeat protein